MYRAQSELKFFLILFLSRKRIDQIFTVFLTAVFTVVCYTGATKRKGGSNMEYVLTTQGLSKHYGRFKALDNLSMHVPKGSIYGFVGKNGAGKTTLIRVI